ncbi:hypothetical protein HGP17_26675 [Rhizobium sp. P38BS-XIX]|uniref:hypothetical protein n=1 Tax=Rhizobium sp. P38BS-XIX TaxID=2726740 RepID=UPI0014572DF1|nr:hypothetical protein [Rhizobium sp. P38BS-XIX]NLS00429.1 hypothetical protein [Rhizobium sp. P38BS-XIX]
MPTELPDPAEAPRGPTSTPGIPDRVQEKPPLTPAQDPGDTKNPNDPTPVEPGLVPAEGPVQPI